MSVLSQYRETLAANGQEMDKIPSLKETERLLLIKSHTPFILDAAKVVDGKFGTQVLYSLKLDITSQEYKDVNRTAQLLGAEYTLWTAATTGRVGQLALLQQFVTDFELEIPGTPLCMIGKNGKEWDFEVYTPKPATATEPATTK
jgi:hypothetical protein